jgi:hypothetical protein
MSLGLASAEPAERLGSTTQQVPVAELPAHARRRLEGWFDSSGHNHTISPGVTHELAVFEGPGYISQITLSILSTECSYLKDLTLRAYWDDSQLPSVKAQLGDFFGLNIGEYATFDSPYLSCSHGNVLRCGLAMPFRKRARITITGPLHAQPVRCSWAVDFRSAQLSPDALYFHARQADNDSSRANPSDLHMRDAHRYLATRGRGHLLGLTFGVDSDSLAWGNIREQIIIDGCRSSIRSASEHIVRGVLHTTSNRAGIPFAHRTTGVPLIKGVNSDQVRYCSYRWYDPPVTFDNKIESFLLPSEGSLDGGGIRTVAYWYQDSIIGFS